MEDFGGISLKDYFASNQTRYRTSCRFANESLQEFLQVAIALCDTLDILIRDRIIHKDIKPANILINQPQPIYLELRHKIALIYYFKNSFRYSLKKNIP